MNKLSSKPVFYILIIFLFFASCRSRTVEVATPVVKETISEMKPSKVDSVYAMMKSQQFNAEWMSGQFKGVYQTVDNQQSFTGQIRMRKDSIIWISIYAVMNIEIFRLKIEPDTFMFIDRLSKTYMIENTKFLKDRFQIDLDFQMLQSVLMGNDFPYYENNVFKINESMQNYQLSTIARRKLKACYADEDLSNKILIQDIWIDKQNSKITRQSVKLVGDNRTKFTVRYDDFSPLKNTLFPMLMNFKLKEEDNSFLEIEYSSLEPNIPQVFPFKIPKTYSEKSKTQ
jgi:hypothetical protein